MLGPDVQVLNFGVDGYGLDQAYLRYRRDVRQWKPDLVLIGMFPLDIVRTMVVYPFITFTEWNWPLAKPRFILADNELRLLSASVPEPSKTFSLPAVSGLPHIDYDFGYSRTDWNWRSGPMFLRYLTSLSPRCQSPGEKVSDAAMVALNIRILNDFFALVRTDGSQPLGVYFPANSEADFPDSSNALGPRLMAQSRVPFVDLTPCLRAVDRNRRLSSDSGFLGREGNLAAAEFIAARISDTRPSSAVCGRSPGSDRS
jgi:hypothetical protein